MIFCEDNSLFSPSFESLSSGPKSAQRGGRRKDRPLVYIVITPQSEGLFHINVRSGPMSKKASSAPLAKPTAPVTTPAATGMSITPSAAVAAVHDAAAKAAAKAAAAKAAKVMPRARSSSESKVAADADKEKAPALRTQSGLAASAVSALYSRMGARQHDAAPATNFSSLLMAGPLIDGMLISSDGLAFLIQRSCKNLARAVVQLMVGVCYVYFPDGSVLKRHACSMGASTRFRQDGVPCSVSQEIRPQRRPCCMKPCLHPPRTTRSRWKKRKRKTERRIRRHMSNRHQFTVLAQKT